VVFIVVVSISLENCTAIFVFEGTFTAPLSGVVNTTTGFNVSTPCVLNTITLGTKLSPEMFLIVLLNLTVISSFGLKFKIGSRTQKFGIGQVLLKL
jgi:hypothetical protein